MEFVVQEAVKKVLDSELLRARQLRQKQVRVQSSQWSEERRKRFELEKIAQKQELATAITEQVQTYASNRIQQLLAAHDLAIAEVGVAHRAAAGLRKEQIERQERAQELKEAAEQRGEAARRLMMKTQKEKVEAQNELARRKEIVRKEEDRKVKEMIEASRSKLNVGAGQGLRAGRSSTGSTERIPLGPSNKGNMPGVIGSGSDTIKDQSAANRLKYPGKVSTTPSKFRYLTRGRSKLRSSFVLKKASSSSKNFGDKLSRHGRDVTQVGAFERTARAKSKQKTSGQFVRNKPMPRYTSTIPAAGSTPTKPHTTTAMTTTRGPGTNRFRETPSGTHPMRNAASAKMGIETSNVRYFDTSIPKPETRYKAPAGLGVREPERSSPDAWNKADAVTKMTLQELEEKTQRQEDLLRRSDERGKNALRKARLEKKLINLTTKLMSGEGEEAETLMGTGRQISLLGLEESSPSPITDDQFSEMTDSDVESDDGAEPSDRRHKTLKKFKFGDFERTPGIKSKKTSGRFAGNKPMPRYTSAIPTAVSTPSGTLPMRNAASAKIGIETEKSNVRYFDTSIPKPDTRHAAPTELGIRELERRSPDARKKVDGVTKIPLQELEEKAKRQEDVLHGSDGMDKNAPKQTRLEKKLINLKPQLISGEGKKAKTLSGTGRHIPVLDLEESGRIPMEDQFSEMTDSDVESDDGAEPSDRRHKTLKKFKLGDFERTPGIKSKQKTSGQFVGNKPMPRYTSAIPTAVSTPSGTLPMRNAASAKIGIETEKSNVRYFDTSIPKPETRYKAPAGLGVREPERSSPDAWNKADAVTKMTLQELEEKAKRQEDVLHGSDEMSKNAPKHTRLEKKLINLKPQLISGEGKKAKTLSGTERHIPMLDLEESGRIPMDDQFSEMSDSDVESDAGAEPSDRPHKTLKKSKFADRDHSDLLEMSSINTTTNATPKPTEFDSPPAFSSTPKHIKLSGPGKNNQPEGPYTSTPDGRMTLKNLSSRSVAVAVSRKDMILHQIVSGFLTRRLESIELLQVSSSSSSNVQVDSTLMTRSPSSTGASSSFYSSFGTLSSANTSTDQKSTPSSGAANVTRTKTWQNLLVARTLAASSTDTDGEMNKSKASKTHNEIGTSNKEGKSINTSTPIAGGAPGSGSATSGSTLAEATIRTVFDSTSASSNSTSKKSPGGGTTTDTTNTSNGGDRSFKGTTTTSTSTNTGNSTLLNISVLKPENYEASFRSEINKPLNQQHMRSPAGSSDPTRDTTQDEEQEEQASLDMSHLSEIISSIKNRSLDSDVPSSGTAGTGGSSASSPSSKKALGREIKRAALRTLVGEISDYCDFLSPMCPGTAEKCPSTVENQEDNFTSIFDELHDDFARLMAIQRPPWSALV